MSKIIQEHRPLFLKVTGYETRVEKDSDENDNTIYIVRLIQQTVDQGKHDEDWLDRIELSQEVRDNKIHWVSEVSFDDCWRIVERSSKVAIQKAKAKLLEQVKEASQDESRHNRTA